MNARLTSISQSNSQLLKQPKMRTSQHCNSVEANYPCDWLVNPDKWEKERFSEEIIEFIECSQGINAFPNMVLIGMLTHQIDIYVECSRQITQNGLIEGYNKGATTGPSLYFSMADKALNRVIQIMKELGLTPAHRVGVVRAQTPESLAIKEFLEGPF